MASNAFQEGLKNYRDLLYLNRNLDRWTESLTAFDDILDTRQRAYEQRLPKIDESLSSVDLDAMLAHRLELESRLQAIERSEDFVALGTQKEQQSWQTLIEMEPAIAALPNDADSDEIRAKQRFLKGLLAWDLQRDYKARLWAEKKSLIDLDRQLREAQRARIDGLRPRMVGLQADAQAALTKQQAFLQDVAVAELKAQRDRLGTYMIQARFALASIYDRASASATPERTQTLAGSPR
jgi:hypothetical protein